MQTKFLKAFLTGLAFMIIIAAISFSCQKDVLDNQSLQANNAATEDISAQFASAHAPYNLDVILSGPGNNGGFIKFRQDKDTAKIINLNTWVGNLRPNRKYLLQRAVNPITDTTQCSSTAWLTLGEGLQPKSIETDGDGNGHEDLWRDVSAVASGTQFYIHFQVIDSLTLKTVLTSGCYQYTVR
jgi:hypothetical protein